MYSNDTIATNAMGGTELMKNALLSRLPEEMQSDYQFFVSRVEDPMDETKIRIYWLHDLPGDPASEHLKDNGWAKFHKLVFVSNWQMQAYINTYNIPYSKCIVIQNAIEPIPAHEKPDDGIIRLAYWSTPHRGLNILVPVFEKLCEKYDNIELDVYSSFNIYGWKERDEAYEDLFEQCRNHPKINYYGTVANDELRENLKKTHILAYPNTWVETSCLVLMEAMSAGMVCVHPNLGALYETAANWTAMYQFREDLYDHANHFYNMMEAVLEHYNDPTVKNRAAMQKVYADGFYNWEVRQVQWQALLMSLKNEPRALPVDSGPMFNYKT
jgi:glycosyltransferase involved in cell wall biosynthesis